MYNQMFAENQKKKICTANCFQFILCMIEIINHNLLFKLETSICSSFLALIGLFFKRNLFSSQKTRGNLQHGLSFPNKYITVANKICTIITGTQLPQKFFFFKIIKVLISSHTLSNEDQINDCSSSNQQMTSRRRNLLLLWDLGFISFRL